MPPRDNNAASSAFVPHPHASGSGLRAHLHRSLRSPSLVRRRPRAFSPAPAAREPCVALARVHERAAASASGKKKPRRKTGVDIMRERDSRARQPQTRRALVATWGGVVLAESAEYEFLDGRFYFPGGHVRWESLRENGRTRFHNPVGLVRLYDVEVRKGGRTIRNRSALARFDDELKRPWEVMKGYAYFWKGVKVFAKPTGFREERKEEDAVETEAVKDGVSDAETESGVAEEVRAMVEARRGLEPVLR